MAVRPPVIIVTPGDDPPQIQGSPQLERLEPYGEVRSCTPTARARRRSASRARRTPCAL